MRFVKEVLGKGKIRYFYPGDTVELPELPGLKFYVLGPPKSWDDVEVEAGKEGESYRHNKELKGLDAFAASVLRSGTNVASIAPFETHYETSETKDVKSYTDPLKAWQQIEEDWLMSAGSLALRINSTTNNLSLVLAIEAEGSKKVMLFPGDAEYGSWASWHRIDWKGVSGSGQKHHTEELLNHTVFYKVAHHMSHNGTAQAHGLEMMNHPDLIAMATLDYQVIAKAWKNTMPNRAMLKELLERTKGRLVIMNESGMHYDFSGKETLSERIISTRKKMSKEEAERFDLDLQSDPDGLYYDLLVRL